MLTESLVDGMMAMGGAPAPPSHFIRRRLPRVRSCAAAAVDENGGSDWGKKFGKSVVVGNFATVGETGMRGE